MTEIIKIDVFNNKRCEQRIAITSEPNRRNEANVHCVAFHLFRCSRMKKRAKPKAPKDVVGQAYVDVFSFQIIQKNGLLFKIYSTFSLFSYFLFLFICNHYLVAWNSFDANVDNTK